MKRFFSATTLLLVASMLMAQAQMERLPIDPEVRVGVLDNGLTYYIRHNEQPKERCEFHIAQAVGAILEEDNQNGLAHFLEHMAFNGTQHFPGKGIINYFEQNGVSFGRNINAYTSLDETVYRLSDVPTTREGLVDSALLVLHDWSCGLLLEGDEIDAERGVIREEWRTRSEASRRIWTKSLAKMFAGTQYAKRDVIGDTAVINNFSYEALRNYYHKWYGPDLQAIVIVGDIDVDKMEQKVKALFTPIKARENRGERPIYEIGNNTEPIVAVITDSEANYTQHTIVYKHNRLPKEMRGTMIDYMHSMLRNMVSMIISYRFDELTNEPDANFVAGNGYYSTLMSRDGFQMSVFAKEGYEKAALRDLAIEAERLQRYGVTASEFERAKTEFLAACETMYNDRDKRQNINLTHELIRHYLDDECTPGLEWEFNTAKMLLPNIKVDMFNQMAQSLVTDTNMIVRITAPEKEAVQLPSEEEILAILADVQNAEIDAPKEDVIDQPLVKKAPKAGKIKKTTNNASLGATEWLLKNGVKVVIKPTTFKNDEILMNAVSAGGLATITNIDDMASASFSADIASNNGAGNFSLIELQKILAGKVASVSPSIDEYTESMTGNSSVKDFETMLQLAYLAFTAPRRDDKAFQSRMNMYHTALNNREANPQAAFGDSITLTTGDHNPRLLLFSKETLDKIDQEKALKIYTERFANPADFTFMFTGNIDPNDKNVKALICKWLGGLKTKKTRESYINDGVCPPQGNVKNYFERTMQTHTASNHIQYSAELPYSLQTQMTMEVIGRILYTRYLESIREREGGSYGVSVAGLLQASPMPLARLIMQFDTDPEKQARLMEIIHEEVKTIAENGPLADDLGKVKSNLLKSFEERLEKNSWWNGTALPRFYTAKFPVDMIDEYRNTLENITAETVQQTLKAVLEQNRVFEVVMMPEK